ncbi:copper chaperone for superoxide dismutase isoform X3 [Cervus canadensis]|uniref:copper chaperone for superoxide dismutase isoform X3 n=1 Tax=Cervus canadensis TaxID=1574408 RepID=UPI001CA375CF|nr:copper chaperone for superoxide dismutase isoform X3 [Cervus canadensis]
MQEGAEPCVRAHRKAGQGVASGAPPPPLRGAALGWSFSSSPRAIVGFRMASDPEDRGTACTLEFAVQMTCQSCVDAVRTSLQGIAGVQSVEVQLENQMVLVQTTLPSQEVQALLEGTGRQAVLKGMGSGLLQNLGAAVAILGGPGPVQGVVRFLQLTPERCLIEGTIDGLQPGLHGLHIHQFGDLTRNCNSCGDHFNPDGMSHGGPQDSERVSVGLGLAENPRSQRHGRRGSLSPSFYFVRFKNIYRHFLCSRPDPVSQPGEGDTQNSMVAAQPEHLCRSLREALGTQSKLQIQSEGHRQWERASQRSTAETWGMSVPMRMAELSSGLRTSS